MPKVIPYSKGSIVYFAGDRDERVFILQKGHAVLTFADAETGGNVTSALSAGEFFGVKSALGHFPREETVSVLADSTVVCLSVQEFERLVSGNEQLLIKMLRVFSGQLRQIHKKTEAVLRSVPVNQENGMLTVAKSFFGDEQYRSCADVCRKLLARFPQTACKEEAEKLLETAQSCAKDQKPKSFLETFSAESSPQDSALRQLSSPAFDRFAKIYEPEEVIISEFEPGDAFYLIQNGTVQLIKCVNGAKKNLDILRPGEFFGEMAILDNSPRSATCMAKTKVKCLEFSKENFAALITGNQQIAVNLLRLFCKRIYDQKRKFRTLVIRDPQARVADVFLMLSETEPRQELSERMRRFDVTVADIAQWAGLPQETVRDEINRLAEKHRIEVFDDHITVTNLADMRRLVESRAGLAH